MTDLYDTEIQQSMNEYLIQALHSGASDMHITVFRPVTLRVNGNLISVGDHNLTPDETAMFAQAITNDDQFSELQTKGE